MKIALVGLPGSGKTTLFNALAEKPVDLLPGVPGAAPHVTVTTVRDARMEWLRDHFKPKKYTPASLVVEDHPGLPPGSAKADRKGETFSKIRTADGLVVVLRAFATDRYAYSDPKPDPARDLELISLEFLTADFEICQRRLEKLDEEWKRPKERDRVERERGAVQRLTAALGEGRGAHTVELKGEEEKLVRGFQLLTRKPVVILVNLAEGGAGAPQGTLDAAPLRVAARFDACLSLEAELAALSGEERAAFSSDYGITEPLPERFNLACYRALGLRSFFTVGEDEVRAWTIESGDPAVEAAGKIHTDLARGFIRAEVVNYDHLKEAGSMKDAKAKGHYRLEGRDYVVADGDILNIRFSV